MLPTSMPTIRFLCRGTSISFSHIRVPNLELESEIINSSLTNEMEACLRDTELSGISILLLSFLPMVIFSPVEAVM